eukprot:gene53766-30800_t
MLRTSQVQHNATLDIYKDPQDTSRLDRANKIVCTIGPKTQPVEKIKELIEYHAKTIANARAAIAELGREDIAIALDTKGPEIRTGNFTDGDVTISPGDAVILTTNRDFYDKGTKEKFYVDYTNITKVMKPGEMVFLDDGLLSLEVKEIRGDEMACVAVNGASISNHRGVNLPNKDKKDLEFGAEQGVDMIFASFIRTAEQVREVRAALGEKGKGIMIIAKIENHEGVRNFDSILAETDGVMIPAEKVFVAQKMMIAKCNIAGKPVICATQMLESMTSNPRPTRAEVSDTAKGKYPAICVETMGRVCREAQFATQGSLMFQAIRSLSTRCIILAITRHCFSWVWNAKTGQDLDREQRVEMVVTKLKEQGFLQAGHRAILVHADAATVGFANQTRVMEIQ